MARDLAKNRPVILYDARGSGKTKEPGVGYSLDVLAGDLLTLLDGLGLKKVILHGHSVGASTALLFTAQHPERVRTLSLEDMSGMPYKARTDKNMIETFELINFLRKMKPQYTDKEKFLADLKPLSQLQPESFVTSMLLKAELRESKTWSPGKAAGIEELMLDVGTRDLSSLFPQIKVPLQIMKAEYTSKYLTELQIEKIHRLKPDTRIVWIPNSGHSIHNEQPGLWLLHLNIFLNTSGNN